MDERVFHNVVDDGAKTEFICNRNNDKCRALFFLFSFENEYSHETGVATNTLCVGAWYSRLFYLFDSFALNLIAVKGETFFVCSTAKKVPCLRQTSKRSVAMKKLKWI